MRTEPQLGMLVVAMVAVVEEEDMARELVEGGTAMVAVVGLMVAAAVIMGVAVVAAAAMVSSQCLNTSKEIYVVLDLDALIYPLVELCPQTYTPLLCQDTVLATAMVS